MAAIALPISELEPVRIESRKAQAETERVVVCSSKERPDGRIFWAILWKTVALRYRFSRLATKQAKVLAGLVDADFSTTKTEELENLALTLDGVVADERHIFELTKKLGAEIRAWWQTSLTSLSEQIEYLESISMSLHAAADPEASLLMSIAVEQMEASYLNREVVA